MSSSRTAGIASAFDDAAARCNDVSTVTTNWFVNRCPLATRTPRVPVGATTFTILSRSKLRGPDDSALSTPLSVSQFCETWTHAAHVGSSSEGRPAIRTPFDSAKMDALQRLMEDMETSCYYGEGRDPAASVYPKQKGLRRLLMVGHNVIDRRANHDAYKPTDLIRDTLERSRLGDGNPDVLLVSSDFQLGFAAWGQALQRLDAGTTVFGERIDVFESPFLGGISIVVAPLLRPGTAVALTSSEVRMRMRRNEFWNPAGKVGSAMEGEWVAEGAIEIDNPGHHAWVEGITAFASMDDSKPAVKVPLIPRSNGVAKAPRTLGEAVIAKWRDAAKG